MTVVILCSICGEERTIIRSAGSSKAYLKRHPVCRKCGNTQAIRRGDKSYAWRGGRREKRGYVEVRLSPDNFFFPMTHNGYVPEHRLVIAKSLGRCLQSWEIVHHKNGIKNDNCLENLEMATVGQHSIDHGKGYRDGYAKGLQDGREKHIQGLITRVDDVLKEVRLLRWENKQLREQAGVLT